MAKVGGRSWWIAGPVTLLCLAVVGALVWLAAPGVPGAVTFVGDVLRGSTAAEARAQAEQNAVVEPATDCRSLYPDRLWAEMVWTDDVLLSQTTAAPAAADALAQALAPRVVVTCTWKTADTRTVSSTIAEIGAGSAGVVEAALASEGFSCATQGETLHCERASGAVSELHDLRGTRWLSSVLTGWSPEDYGAQTAARAFGD